MSHTFHPMRKSRLQRSELAVPGSNVTFIDKAADSAADVVFLDLEDAVAPPEKEQARQNVVAALNDIDWAGKGKTISVRINGLDTQYMYRDVIDIMEQAGGKLDTILVPKVGVPADLYCVRDPGRSDRAGQGADQAGRYRGADRDRARHGERGGDREQRRPAGGAAFRGRRLRREQPCPHGQYRRAEPRLPGRPVALRAVPHDRRLPGVRAAADRRPVRRLLRPRRLPGRARAGPPRWAPRASGPSTPARSRSPTRSSARRRPRSSALSGSSRRCARPRPKARARRRSTAR